MQGGFAVNTLLWIVKVLFCILPGIIPDIAFYIQWKAGNPFCWLWLAGGICMGLAVGLTLYYCPQKIL
jgi:hypothetical protein